jgi:hypothetical protein
MATPILTLSRSSVTRAANAIIMDISAYTPDILTT